MPTPAIIKGSDNFFTNIYEGNGRGQRVGKFVPFTNNGTIANSCIFDGATAQARVGRTPSSNGSGTILTFSAWVKRGRLGSISTIFITNDYATYGEALEFNTSNQLNYYCIKSTGGVYDWNYITNRTFEDTSKWYHIYVRRDTTDSTAADRVQIYIDGERVTSWNTETQSALNRTGWMNQTTYENSFGNTNNASYVRGIGYLAEVNMVDGSNPAVSTFGVTDTSTGRWIPKTLSGITYGTNGFRMQFQDSSALGDDTSGNGNDLTATNLASTDQTTDSPTQNFMVWDAARNVSHDPIMSEGNLKVGYTSGAGTYPASRAGKEIPQSGKWYWEVKCTHTGGVQGITNSAMGVIDLNIKDIPDFSSSKPFVLTQGGMGSMFYGGFVFNGLLRDASTGGDFTTSTAENLANNDYMLFAFDMDNGKAWWGWNNSSAGSSVVWFANDGGTDGDPGAGTNPTVTFTPSNHRFVPAQGGYAPGSYPGIFEFNFGQKTNAFTAPAGFGGLSQNNFAETGKGIPDYTWIKNRDAADGHQLYDSNRGPKQKLNSDSNAAEATISDGLQKFLKGGVEIEDDDSINTISESYVAWNWVANGGTTTANTDGSGASLASTVQANPTAGFSIVTYAGSSSGAKTVAHGLSQIPEMIWIKNRTDSSRSWFVYHINASYASMVPYDGNAAYYLNLDGNGARGSGNVFNNTAPTNKVFHIQDAGSLNTNGSGKNYIAYCFHSVHGYSQIGKYLGNGSANGTFVYTGFKPAWLMVKCLSPTGTSWIVWDNTRSKFNPRDNVLYPDLTSAETASGNDMDFLSNGFKARGTNGNYNTSSRNYTYMAFAEHPLEGNGTNPATAL